MSVSLCVGGRNDSSKEPPFPLPTSDQSREAKIRLSGRVRMGERQDKKERLTSAAPLTYSAWPLISEGCCDVLLLLLDIVPDVLWF